MSEDSARGSAVPAELLWNVLSVSSDAACVASLEDGTILWVNDAFVAATGRPREELIGRRGSDAGVWPADVFDGSLPDAIPLITPGGPVDTDSSCQEVNVDSKPCVLFVARTGSGLSGVSLLDGLPGIVYLESLEEGSPDTYVSSRYEALFGESSDEVLGRPLGWAESIHPDDRQFVIDETEVGNRSLEPVILEYRIVRGDGEIRWVRDESALVRDSEGRPLHWVGYLTDITGEKESESRRIEAEARFRSVVEQIPAAVYLESPVIEDFYISPKIQDITGYPPEFFDDETFWASKIHPDDAERVLEEERRSEESGEPFSMEYRYIRNDGEVVWLREDSRRLPLEGGRMQSVGIIADVTAEKTAQERISQAETRYRDLVEKVPAITYRERVWGAGTEDSAIVYVSPRIESLLGWKPPSQEQTAADYWRPIIHPDDYERIMSEAGSVGERGEPFKAEYRVMTTDSRILWVLDESVVVGTDPDGSLVWHGVIFDITARKTAELEARRGEAILQSVSFAGERLLRTGGWVAAIDDVLESIGKASGASRSYLFEFRDEDGARRAYETNEWCAEGIEGTIERPENQGYLLDELSPDLREAMDAGLEFQQLLSGSSEVERDYLSSQGVQSALVVPIFVSGRLWGNLGFDDCVEERWWSAGEVGALRTAASTLGAAITRQDFEMKLREAEVTHRTLVERVPAVIYRADAARVEGPVTYVSPQYKAMFGYTPEERLADPRLWTRLVHPDDLQMVLDASRVADKAGEPFSMEYRVYRRDGRLIWVSDESVLVRDASGDASFWLGIITDITNRKAVEEELRRRDSILEAVGFAATQFLHAESWEECIADVLRQLGRAGDVSRAYLFKNSLDQAGSERTSITNEWVAEGIEAQIDNVALKNRSTSQPSHAGEQPAWAKVMAGGGYYLTSVEGADEAERELLKSQDIKSILEVPIFVGAKWWGFLGFDECRWERTWSLAEIEALRAAAGLLGAVIQRTGVESQLREAEESYRLLIEQLPSVVYMDAIDDRSTSLYISPQIEDLLGYTTEEWVSEPDTWIEAIHPDDREAVLAESLRTNEAGEDWFMDYRIYARDGRLVWVHDEAVLVRDEEGEPLHWQGVLSDVTDRKEAEAELARALQLEREAGERLRALDEMKNTFLTAVSHDFRTPLAAVLGLALTLERGDIGLEEKESIDLAHRIATNARKLDRLVTDLLDLDRLSRGIMEPNLARTDLGLLVQKVVAEADYLGDHPVTVEAESLEISIDSAKVERIVENLIANSVRHTPEGTRIWVKVVPEGAGALILVEDEGPGVLVELRDAIFEPFRQGSVVEASPGVGIGLSLVARFAELQGGRAWVAEREGGGASFRVFLPGQ